MSSRKLAERCIECRQFAIDEYVDGGLIALANALSANCGGLIDDARLFGGERAHVLITKLLPQKMCAHRNIIKTRRAR